MASVAWRFVKAGYCARTRDGEGNCEAGVSQLGSWTLPQGAYSTFATAAAACTQRCAVTQLLPRHTLYLSHVQIILPHSLLPFLGFCGKTTFFFDFWPFGAVPKNHVFFVPPLEAQKKWKSWPKMRKNDANGAQEDRRWYGSGCSVPQGGAARDLVQGY